MQRQSLNINVQPIMLDMNSIIEEHINKSVKAFNIQYINREITEHLKKISILKEELTRIQSDDYNINENIQLEINDDKTDEIIKCSDNKSVDTISTKDDQNNMTVDETKTNKVVSMGDETQTKKVTMNYFDQFVAKPDSKNTDTNVAVPETDIVVKDVGPEDDDEEEEEQGVFEIEVDGVSYYTTDEMNGELYTIDVNGDPEDMVGKLVDGEAIFNT